MDQAKTAQINQYVLYSQVDALVRELETAISVEDGKIIYKSDDAHEMLSRIAVGIVTHDKLNVFIGLMSKVRDMDLQNMSVSADKTILDYAIEHRCEGLVQAIQDHGGSCRAELEAQKLIKTAILESFYEAVENGETADFFMALPVFEEQDRTEYPSLMRAAFNKALSLEEGSAALCSQALAAMEELEEEVSTELLEEFKTEAGSLDLMEMAGVIRDYQAAHPPQP